MSYASAAHDRMLAGLIMPCRVVAVDLVAARVRVSDGAGWTSAWLRWHSLAAGEIRHWRAPSMDEQGMLISPSGDPAQGTFLPGLYGNAGVAPDNRGHTCAWHFPDGGSLVYDWQARQYSISLPSGTVAVQVGAAALRVTDDQIAVQAGAITLNGPVTIDGPLSVTGDITGGGRIIDTAGNTPNHSH